MGTVYCLSGETAELLTSDNRMQISFATMRLYITLAVLSIPGAVAFSLAPDASNAPMLTRCYSTAFEESKTANTEAVLDAFSAEQADEWSEMFSLGKAEGAVYSLFQSIRETMPIGLRSKPFHLTNKDICNAVNGDSEVFAGYFSYDDLTKAVDADFLDAGRGTTDNRKGWKMTTVSTPRGNSFEEARMTMEEVEHSLEQGTVIFNSAGAHIPKLAGATLACTDATSLPNALNLYVTAPGKRTSAPPHTDKQDVLVVQTSGRKHWKVYSPPTPSLKPNADMFARGKGDDNLPLFSLKDAGCDLLLETTLNEGDVLFIPAAFPHTTDTAEEGSDVTSIHMTFGLDTRIWGFDYLSLRSLALKRAGIQDTSGLGQKEETDNMYTGKINVLPKNIRNDLLEALPMGLLDAEPGDSIVQDVASRVEEISKEVDEKTYTAIDTSVWKETTERLQEHGKVLLEIHRDMYISAVEEGHLREQEAAMTAHLPTSSARKTLTPDQIQRLSLFRVKRHFDKIEVINKALHEWTLAGKPPSTKGGAQILPTNWAYTLPLKIGDEVEADLGGAFFPAKVTRAAGDKYDVQFFDGDRETDVERSMIKLLAPPSITEEDDLDTSDMTPKQLKRWKKQQKNKK